MIYEVLTVAFTGATFVLMCGVACLAHRFIMAGVDAKLASVRAELAVVKQALDGSIQEL